MASLNVMGPLVVQVFSVYGLHALAVCGDDTPDLRVEVSEAGVSLQSSQQGAVALLVPAHLRFGSLGASGLAVVALSTPTIAASVDVEASSGATVYLPACRLDRLSVACRPGDRPELDCRVVGTGGCVRCAEVVIECSGRAMIGSVLASKRAVLRIAHAEARVNVLVQRSTVVSHKGLAPPILATAAEAMA